METQGEEHYKQDTYDDDQDEQKSDHGIDELQMEEQEEPDKVAIFE